MTWIFRMQMPARYQVLDVLVSSTDYREVCERVTSAALARESLLVAHAPVHLVAACSRDEELARAIAHFDIVAPDGQPVRWALRWLHGRRLSDRVYGPHTMMKLCERAERHRIPIYLFGSTSAVLERLEGNLRRRFPGIVVAGSEAPPFRPLDEEETALVAARMNRSGAGLVFLGLGCPKQEKFAFALRSSVPSPLICVGAAFDFLAGNKPMAPAWMQRAGLEWFFRLCAEPRRLWRRYLVTNSYFAARLIVQIVLGWTGTPRPSG